MKKIRIGVICPSEIAYRRFMPALLHCGDFEYSGVAVASCDEWGGEFSNELLASETLKANRFRAEYGGKVFKSYSEMMECDDIDAVYLPLPPALHYKWGRIALEHSKHLFLEKPSTCSLADTEALADLAIKKGLALHENYMFSYHSQLEYIENFIKSGRLGDIRLYRIAFGFPKRDSADFRYNKALGGGALLDCGGYTLKLALRLLGDTAKIAYSKLNYPDGYDVDIFGNAALINDGGIAAQCSFGMDNAYKCELEVWGSLGTLKADRILTAPAGFNPVIEYKNGNEPVERITLEADDTFRKSILHFKNCIEHTEVRKQNISDIVKQAGLVEMVKKDKSV